MLTLVIGFTAALGLLALGLGCWSWGRPLLVRPRQRRQAVCTPLGPLIKSRRPCVERRRKPRSVDS